MIYNNTNQIIIKLVITLTFIILIIFGIKHFTDLHRRTINNWGCANFDEVNISLDNPFQQTLLYFGGLYAVSTTPTSTLIVAETFFHIPFNTIEVSCTEGGIRII